MPWFSLPARVSCVRESGVGTRHLHTVKLFHAFPLGRLDLSTRPSTSKSPLSSMVGLLMVIARVVAIGSEGLGSNKFAGRCRVGPGSTRTVRTWVLGWIDWTWVTLSERTKRSVDNNQNDTYDDIFLDYEVEVYEVSFVGNHISNEYNMVSSKVDELHLRRITGGWHEC